MIASQLEFLTYIRMDHVEVLGKGIGGNGLLKFEFLTKGNRLWLAFSEAIAANEIQGANNAGEELFLTKDEYFVLANDAVAKIIYSEKTIKYAASFRFRLFYYDYTLYCLHSTATTSAFSEAIAANEIQVSVSTAPSTNQPHVLDALSIWNQQFMPSEIAKKQKKHVWVCINVDGAVHFNTSMGSIGGLARDSNGNWIIAVTTVQDDVVGSNSNSLVRAIAKLSRGHWDIEVKWIPRESNRPADKLAKQAHEAQHEVLMLDMPLENLLPLLENDIIDSSFHFVI
ncbi:hypothetical protein V6N12_037454 [Hibiscus sabdariffa]|uniref:RNase H type-1 domain-containing protein n=1 Tax=Hibiscus sabdariffa TaxID=183260 RepID=A0ABR2AVB4_9ROSI